MKLVTFSTRQRTHVGMALDAGVATLDVPSLRALLSSPARLADVRKNAQTARPDVAWTDVTLLPPVPDPARILCVGANYREHREEMGHASVAHPTLFTRFASTLVGSGQPLALASEVTEFDYEGELAVVIGARCRRVSKADALKVVAGYACFQDATARDWQRHTPQFTAGKNFPATGGFGPALVTADEVGDPQNLRLSLRLNGQVMQQARTDEMMFDIPTLIAYITTFTELEPGDVVATGTPSGVGSRLDPPVFLRDGDLLEVDIERVGTLVNGVAGERA
ncbi:MAG: fumarylacetoacetate hydrolase family protein [Myxococcaceae bacterium]